MSQTVSSEGLSTEIDILIRSPIHSKYQRRPFGIDIAKLTKFLTQTWKFWWIQQLNLDWFSILRNTTYITCIYWCLKHKTRSRDRESNKEHDCTRKIVCLLRVLQKQLFDVMFLNDFIFYIFINYQGLIYVTGTITINHSNNLLF